jgi:hypothetical protein
MRGLGYVGLFATRRPKNVSHEGTKKIALLLAPQARKQTTSPSTPH